MMKKILAFAARNVQPFKIIDMKAEEFLKSKNIPKLTYEGVRLVDNEEEYNLGEIWKKYSTNEKKHPYSYMGFMAFKAAIKELEEYAQIHIKKERNIDYNDAMNMLGRTELNGLTIGDRNKVGNMIRVAAGVNTTP